MIGDITIDNAKIIAKNHDTEPAVGAANHGRCGDITITNSYIYYRGVSGAAIGTAGYPFGRATSGSITTDNCELDIKVTGGGAGIGIGYNSVLAGDIFVTNTDLSKVIVTGGGEQVGRGVRGIIIGKTILKENDYNTLKIHHGTQANQATNFYINDMHTKSLGTFRLISGNLPINASDLARYDAPAYDDDLQAAWLKTLKLAQYKTLDDLDVITKQNANVAIRVIDGAIEYALNEATNIGAYLQRLEYTGMNITTMNENVQSAESTIRDADMAKEMTEYTKFNVLQQASQSMLVQANQNVSSVLSLLQ